MTYRIAPPNGKSIPDAEIIEKILIALGMNARQLGEKLKFKSPSSIANVKKGYHGISEEMMFKFRTFIPQVNENYLRTGEGSILTDGTNVTRPLSIPKDPKEIHQFTVYDLKDVPNRLARIEANQLDLKDKIDELISILKK